MNFETVRAYFELGYFASQILLVFVAIVAAWYAAGQLKTLKTHEMLKYIESKESREARLIVMRDIQPIMSTCWWNGADSEKLRKSASDVAAIYDVVYIMLNKESGDIKEMFYRNWADSIIRAHTILEPVR